MNSHSYIKISRTHPLSHPYAVNNISVKTKQIFKTCPPSNSLRSVATDKFDGWSVEAFYFTKIHSPYFRYQILLLLDCVITVPVDQLLSFLNKGLHDIFILRDVRRDTPGVAQLIIFPHGLSAVGLYPDQAKVTLRPQLIRGANE